MRKVILALMAVMCTGMVGCSGTIPTDAYIPQNFTRYEHRNNVDMGTFTYVPLSDASLNLKPNQIQNTAVGSVFISTNVADMVKRATALELEKTGLSLKDSANMAIAGDILEFKADDLGYSVHWTYSIRYKVIDKPSGRPLYAREYRPGMKKTSKFLLPSDFASIVYETVLDGYDMFIRDPRVRKLLDVPQ